MHDDEGIARTAKEIDAFLAGGEAESSRVTLRPVTRGDEEEFLALVHASADLHRPWMSLPATPEEFQTHLGRFDHSTAQGILVCLRDTGAMAGMININSIIRGRYQCGSLAYAAFAPTAGRGYMSEGLGLVVRYAFGRLRLHRLEAQIQPANHASRGLVRRHGFRNEGYSPELLFVDGVWEDHERWALLNRDGDPHPTLPAR